MARFGRHSHVALCLCFLMILFAGCAENDSEGSGNQLPPGQQPTDPGQQPGQQPTDPGQQPGQQPTDPGQQPSDPGQQPGQQPSDHPTIGQACGSLTESGTCYGDVIYYCKDNIVNAYDCSQEQKVCGVLSDETHSWNGCTDKSSGEVTPDPGTQDPGSSTQTGDKNAEYWARARISGTVSTEEAFNNISYNGGFPVITDDNTVIFMHWYEGGNWSVAGDFNNWERQAMTNDGDIWYAEVPMPENVVQKDYYKFVNGDQYVSDPWSLRYGYTEDGEISYIVAPDKPYLMRWNNFKSPQGLPARTVRAYVPAGDGPFDVLYAHDGQNLFGTGGAYGSWKVEDNMAAAGASFIVVGIDNIEQDRLSEYAFADEDLSAVGYGNIRAKGADYAKFVHETVRPFIESQFKVTNKAGLMGSSMGGLVSLYIAHLYPTSYDVVLALSPTTAWGRFSRNDGQTIEDMYAAAGHRGFTLYLDNGGQAPDGECPKVLGTVEASSDEFSRDCYCFTRSFVDKMDEIGYEWKKDLFHHFEPGAQHNEAAWAARLVLPLTIFKDKQK